MYVDAEASQENQTNIAPEDLFGADLASVSVQTSNPDATQPLSAEAFAAASTIVFAAGEAGNEVLGHEVVHTVQHADGNQKLQRFSDAPAAESHGQEIGIISSTVNVLTPTPQTPIGPYLLEIRTELGAEAVAAGAQFSQLIDDEGQQILTDLHGDLLLAFIRKEQLDPEALASETSYYLDFTLQEYIALKDFLGEQWLLGDQGATISPLLNDSGDIVSYVLTNWIVTNESGTFTQVMTVPEPATATLIALTLGCTLLRRRR